MLHMEPALVPVTWSRVPVQLPHSLCCSACCSRHSPPAAHEGIREAFCVLTPKWMVLFLTARSQSKLEEESLVMPLART
jgi:hypothetical protein